MTTLGVGSSDSNGDGYVTGADSTFAGSARRTNENDSQYGCDLTAAEADYSDDLNRNEINYTTSNGAVQNSLISDIVAAQLKFEKDVITELNKLSLAKAEAELARAVKIAEQQKINAVGAVHEEYGDVLTGPFDPSRIMWTGVAVADADKTMIDATADAQATFESTVAALKETLDSTVAARKKQAEKAAAKLVGQLEKDNAADLADYNTAQTDAANDHFTEQTDIFVDWRSADYGAQVTALAWLNTATQIPWTQYLQDKAVCIAAWWADEGADLYTDWAADVCTEYSTYTESVNAAYTTMVTTIADARDAYHDDTPESDDPGTDPGGDPAGMLPVKRDFDAAAAAAQQAADADADYQKALAAANLQLALDNDAAGTDQQALAAAQAAYDSTVAAALLAYQQAVTDAQGDRSVADAQSVDDYVDEVYGEDGAYETWQNAVSGAEAAYKTAESSAKETRDRNLAALDAALEAALADTYADALELLAINHPSPWATRAAADARAKSDRVASEQAAQQTYDEAIATAQAAFADTVAAADGTRSEAQTDALCALKTTLSEANLDKATDQKTTNDTAAANGASTKNPDEQTPPEAEGPVSADDLVSLIAGLGLPDPDNCTSQEWFDAMIQANRWARDHYTGEDIENVRNILGQIHEHVFSYIRAREERLEMAAEFERARKFAEYCRTWRIDRTYLTDHEAHSACLVDVWTEHGTAMVWAIPGGFGENFLTLSGGAVGVKYNGQVARPPRAVLTHSQGQGRSTDAGRELRALTLKGWRKGKGADHQERHGQYMGYQSLLEYTEAAKHFQKMSGNVIEAKVGNMLFKYDHATQRILIVSAKERTIVTFYEARNGIHSFKEALMDHWLTLVKQGHSP